MTSPGGAEVGRISIRVVPDTSRFRAELKAQLEAIEKSLEAKVPVELDFDANGVREKVRAATAGLDKHAKVTVDVDVDKNRIQTAISSIGDKIASVFSKAAPSGGGGGGRGLGIFSAFADNLVVVAAVASIAAPAIALLTGALAALPAVAAGVLAPIGVIALGLDGIKKAAEVLQEPLANLKKSISGVFETRLTPVFGQLAQAMPKLEGPLSAVANGISDVAKSFIDTITSGPGLEKIQGTISNIAAAISTAAPGIGSLTNGLLGLANNVSAKFPAVSKWFNQAADAFSNWVDKASADGSLDRAMGNMGDTIKGLLDIVGDIAKQGFEWLQDPKFAQSMKDFVADLKTLMSDVLPGLGDFFQQLTGLLNAVVPKIDQANEFFKNQNQKNAVPQDQIDPNKGFGKGVIKGSFLDNILPDNGTSFWQGITDSFGTSMQIVETTAIGTFERIKQIALTAFTGIVTSIGSTLASAFGNIEATAAAAWNGVVGVAANVVAQVVTQFVSIPGKIAGALSSIGGVVAGAFAAAVAAVASAGAQMVSQIVSTGARIVSEVASWAGKVASAAASIASSLTGVGAQMIAGFLGGFTGAAAHALSVVSDWAGRIGAAARSALGIHSPSKVFTEIGAQTAQGLQDGLEGGFKGVIDRATALAQKLTEAVNGGLTGVDGGALTDGIKKQLAELELERKTLKTQQDALPKEDKEGRKGLQAQMDQVQAIKDQLSLQSDQLGFSQKYGSELDDHQKSVEQANNIITDSLAKMIDAAKGFATANVNQFQSDLGISGQGAIPQIANMGLDWATSQLSNALATPFGGGKGTTIQVNSVDEALAAKQTLDNKAALQFTGR